MTAADTAGVLWAVVTDAGIGGGTGVLAVVSGAGPAVTPCGSAVETVPVALVTVSVAGNDTDVERRARATEAALELVVLAGGVFFMRLIPWPRISGVFCFALFSGRFGALANFFCNSAFSARSLVTSASEPAIVSDGVGAVEPVVGRLSVRAAIGGRRSSPSGS